MKWPDFYVEVELSKILLIKKPMQSQLNTDLTEKGVRSYSVHTGCVSEMYQCLRTYKRKTVKPVCKLCGSEFVIPFS